MQLDLTDLRLFVAVAEERNLRRGAERVCLSLPAASLRVKRLEDAVGTKLLYRRPQGVELNPAGEAMLLHARRVLLEVEQLQSELGRFADGVKGHVRIFANTTSISGALPAALATFLAAHPGVSIDLHERLSEEIVQAVRETQADIGLVAGGVDTSGLEVHGFVGDELVLVVAKDHPLAGGASVRFIDTLAEPQISLPDGSALAGFLPPIARAAGHELVFRIQVSSFESICLLVQAGVGVGVIPRSAAIRHRQTMRLAIVPLADGWARREIKVVCALPSARTRLAEALMHHLAAVGVAAARPRDDGTG